MHPARRVELGASGHGFGVDNFYHYENGVVCRHAGNAQEPNGAGCFTSNKPLVD